MKNNKNKEIVKKQKGFLSVELVVILAIVAIIAAIAVTFASKFFGGISQTQVKNDVAVSIYSAVSMCSKMNSGNLSTCTRASVIRKSPTLTSEKTACGDTWTLTPVAAQAVLEYPLTSCEDKDDIGAEIVEFVEKLPRVDAAGTSYTSPNIKVTFLNK